MAAPVWQIAYYGAPWAQQAPPEGFQSRGEEVVYWELVRRIGRDSFIYQWRPHGGDIPFTPEQEERSADFAIPALRVVLNPRSQFTHPSPEADAHNAGLFRLLGYETYYMQDYEIVPEMGGDVVAKLDEIPGLRFFGGGVRQYAVGQKREYGQPPRDVSFGYDKKTKRFGR